MVSTTLRPLSVGEILDVSFSLYRQHFATLGTVAILCSGIPVLLSLYIEASGGVLQNRAHAGVLYGVHRAELDRHGRDGVHRLRELSGPSAKRRRRLAAVGTAGGQAHRLQSALAIVMGFGFLFFLIPGVVLLCGLLLAFPSLVLEPGSSPTGALSRSWSLTRGARWRMLGLLVTLVVLLYVPIIALGSIAAVVLPTGRGRHPGVLTLALIGVIQMVLYPFFYCVLTVAYYDLRVRKEGFDLEVLASTLQLG